MASRVPPPPPTAFAATSRREKVRRIDDGPHENFIRRLPCICCGRTDTVQLAHVSYADLRFAKYGRGKGQREESCWVLPLCARHHGEQHGMGEQAFWAAQQIDPVRAAAALYIRSGDIEAAGVILLHARDT